MSKITPFLQEVVYLVADFLTSLEHNKEAQKLKKQFELPEWVKKDNPLIKKGLKKVLKDYINSNQKVLKYYKNRKPESENQEQSQEEVPTPKPTKKQRKSVSPRQSPLVKPKSPKNSSAQVHQPAPAKGWMTSQFQQPKRLQDLNDNKDQSEKQQPEVVAPKKQKKIKKQVKKETSSESESQTPQPKKQKKEIKKSKKQKKTKGPVDSSCLNSEEEFELEDKKSKRSVTPQKKSVEKKKVELPVKTKAQQTKVEIKKTNINHFNNSQETIEQNSYNGPKKFFSRINEKQVGHIPENRRDNTFEAKAKFGVGDAWGQYGHEKLKDTRGDSFKKTKGKLKNKAFQGSGINIDKVNSVPIL